MTSVDRVFVATFCVTYRSPAIEDPYRPVSLAPPVVAVAHAGLSEVSSQYRVVVLVPPLFELTRSWSAYAHGGRTRNSVRQPHVEHQRCRSPTIELASNPSQVGH